MICSLLKKNTLCFENIKYNLASPSWMSGLTTKVLSVAYEKHGNYSVSDEAPSMGRSVCASLQNENIHLGGKGLFFPWLKERFKPRSSPVGEITSNKRSWSGRADSNQSLFKVKKIASCSLLIFFPNVREDRKQYQEIISIHPSL